MSAIRFITEVLPAVRMAYPSGSLECHRLLVAHSAMETGWGESSPYLQAHNLFNVTRLASDERPVFVGNDLEYPKDGGGPKKIKQRFAAYESAEESVEHYMRFINGPRYRPALEQLQAGNIEFIETLGKGGYYTLPAPEYRKRFESVLEMVRVFMPTVAEPA